jgi:hypothetical protein
MWKGSVSLLNLGRSPVADSNGIRAPALNLLPFALAWAVKAYATFLFGTKHNANNYVNPSLLFDQVFLNSSLA